MVEFSKMLLGLNQSHFFEHWPEPGISDDDKLAFFGQGTLGRFKRWEEPIQWIYTFHAGVHEARKTAFVLVAGGLGERLGYNGIKVALPLESTTGTCFLHHYIESILALQETSCRLSQEVRTLELMTWVNWIKLFFCISITKNSMLKIKDENSTTGLVSIATGSGSKRGVEDKGCLNNSTTQEISGGSCISFDFHKKS